MIRRNFLKAGLGAGSLAAPVAARALPQAPAQDQQRPRSQPRMLFYHDGRHPLIYMYEPPIEKEQYEAAVDELAGTPVEAIMFCLGDGRTVLHDTKVGELWGHNVT